MKIIYKKIPLFLCIALICSLCASGITVDAMEQLDKDNLEDGNYIVPANMYQVDKKNLSMSDKSIDKNALLTVKNGQYYITLEFNGITIGNMFGYLGELSYYKKGFTYDKYGNPKGSLGKTTVLSIHRNSDGSVLVDYYNTSSMPYPKQVQFPLVNKATDEGGFVPLQVFVPIMESLSAGSGTQNVLLKLDWSKIKEGGEEPEAEDGIDDLEKVKIDKSKLKKQIEKAEKVKKDKYTKSSYNHLKSTLKTARKIYKKSKVTQIAVNEQVNLLKTAIKNLVKKPSKKVNKENAEDGRYTVYIDFWHATQNRASMGNATLNRKAILDVKDGKFVMSLSVKPMKFGGTTASLITLQIKNKSGGYTYADIVERKLAGGKPSVFRFTLPSKDTYIPIKVDPKVEVMGNKPVDARLKISWDTLQKVSEDEKLSDDQSVTDTTREKSDELAKKISEAAIASNDTASNDSNGNSVTKNDSSGTSTDNSLQIVQILSLLTLAGAASTVVTTLIRRKLFMKGYFF